MPNHVTNKIIIESDNFADAIAFMESSESLFDFNNLIPMPPELDIDEGIRTNAAFIYAITDGITNPVIPDHAKFFGPILNPYSTWENELVSATLYFNHLSPEDKPSFIEFSKQVLENYQKYGFTTWYGWRNEHWNTKWNAYSIKIDQNVVIFDTAWDSPIHVINKFIEKFNLTCIVKAYDEGEYFWFIQNYKDGKLVSERRNQEEDKDNLCLELKGY